MDDVRSREQSHETRHVKSYMESTLVRVTNYQLHKNVIPTENFEKI